MSAYDAKTGSLLWGESLGFEVLAPLAARDHVLVAVGTNGRVAALDCTRVHPNRVWRRSVDAPVEGAPAIADGRILIGADDWFLRCLDLGTGEPIWSYRAEGPIKGTPAVRDGVVYAGDEAGILHAVSLADGKVRWTRRIGAPIRCAPAIDGDIVVTTAPHEERRTGSDGETTMIRKPGAVVILDAGGQERRRWELAEKTISSPSLADGKVYVAAGATLYEDERPLFRAGGEMRSTPVVSDSRIYVGSDDSRMYCIDRETGRVIYDVQAGWYVPAAPAIRNGRAYFVDNHRTIHCVVDFDGADWPQFGGGPERGGFERR